MKPFFTNIEKKTLQNNFYRKVLHTGKKIQLVVMSLKPAEDIPKETHHHIDQFIRVEKGHAKIIVGDKTFSLKSDDSIIIPAGSPHYVKNVSFSSSLKLYSIYSPPEHKPGTIHKTRQEAIDAEESH